ncbi:cell well associated RhsD protein [Lunatimonas lonarensis]|uniref:Cell well associated RhsD protein n=1 Tax=Lunatimonas lonarensis TaxID=1232681 RepID=R7ZY93_9BACT|nr:RHS repeat-associated core domain-containing protein [Lunatimonas lonarensis]EON79013.1 cell well associated RhsD protein [Lunatimonas lonarensis]
MEQKGIGFQYGNIKANKYLYQEVEFNDAIGVYETEYRLYDQQIGRYLSVDPLADQFLSWTPYHYAYNNPIFWNDPTGAAPESGDEFRGLATRHIDPSGRTIINTDDGRDDVFVVPWNRVNDFKRNAEFASETGVSNSVGWSDYWRSEFQMLVSEGTLNTLHSERAKDALIDYLVSGDWKDWGRFLMWEVGGQWTDPELVVGSLSLTVLSLPRSIRNSISPKRVKHIFRDAPGHVADSPANRRMVETVGNNRRNLQGTDNHGNT